VDIGASVGLPLLHSREDYELFVSALPSFLTSEIGEDEAIVVVGHGAKHPSWTSYTAIHYLLGLHHGPGWFSGLLEGRPSREDVLRELLQTGFRRVRLLPLILVAGKHIQEDLVYSEDSWRVFFQKEGLHVTLEEEGLLMKPFIIDLFIRHTREALEALGRG
jgi:sirohydrochlorin cobaltochelatase